MQKTRRARGDVQKNGTCISPMAESTTIRLTRDLITDAPTSNLRNLIQLVASFN